MKSLIALSLAFLVAAPVSAQMISSDPNFVREGIPAYTCVTPLGKSVACNRWRFPNNGWKKLQIRTNETVFGKLPSPDAKAVDIETPSSRHVALYDYMWADHRDLSVLLAPLDHDAATQELINRKLKPVMFEQFIEIKESGMYRMHACMAAQFYEDHYELVDIRDGGVQVTLEQFMGGRSKGPLVHMTLPNKAKWQYDENFGIVSTGMEWVETLDDLPASAERGQVFGVREMHSAWVWDGHRWVWVGSPYTMEREVDSYTGHAGMTMAYHIPIWWDDAFETMAEWTCHESQAVLEPGFYSVRAHVRPVWRDDPDSVGFRYSDHSGFAAIRSIGVEKVSEPVAAN